MCGASLKTPATAIIGDCFEIHGRLSLYNGTPSVRLWPVGTKRLLGVRESDIKSEILKEHLIGAL